jgi:hypothetical protein
VNKIPHLWRLGLSCSRLIFFKFLKVYGNLLIIIFKTTSFLLISMSKYIKKSRDSRARMKYVRSEKHKRPYAKLKQLWEEARKKYPKPSKTEIN